MFSRLRIFSKIPIIFAWVAASLSTSHCHFIELRIYPAIANQTLGDLTAKSSVVWEAKDGIGADLATHNPYIFPTRKLTNRYGSLVGLLEREVRSHPDRYSRLQARSPMHARSQSDGNEHSQTQSTVTRIHVEEFRLETKDQCWKNTTSVSMVVDIQWKGRSYPYRYHESIDSHVTDCYLVGASVLVVPLLVYTPYVGFRGSREDQINQLGRSAITDFLQFLEKFPPKIPHKAENSSENFLEEE